MPSTQTAAQTKFTIANFVAVADALPDISLELIDGRIEIMPPPDKTHQKLTNRLARLLRRHNDRIEALGCDLGGSYSYFEVPAKLRRKAAGKGPSDVCPDVTIHLSDYWDTARTPPALLVAEVLSVSNREHIDRDLVTKPDIYAALEIPNYWVIDRRDQSVRVYTQPQGGQYQVSETFRDDQVIPAVGLEFLQITPAQIFAK